MANKTVTIWAASEWGGRIEVQSIEAIERPNSYKPIGRTGHPFNYARVVPKDNASLAREDALKVCLGRIRVKLDAAREEVRRLEDLLGAEVVDYKE